MLLAWIRKYRFNVRKHYLMHGNSPTSSISICAVSSSPDLALCRSPGEGSLLFLNFQRRACNCYIYDVSIGWGSAAPMFRRHACEVCAETLIVLPLSDGVLFLYTPSKEKPNGGFKELTVLAN